MYNTVMKEPAHVYYTFVGKYDNLMSKLIILKKLFRLAFLRSYGVIAPDDIFKNHDGKFLDYRFSHTIHDRLLCVSVSDHPTGVGAQVSFDLKNRYKSVMRNCTMNELVDAQKFGLDDESMYFIHAKKVAYKNKYPERQFGDFSTIDTTEEDYTLHKAECDGSTFYIAATDDAEFIKIPIEEMQPRGNPR